MKLLIKQRVFSWTDSYDIYDEDGTVRYFVKSEFFSLGHRLNVYDSNQNEIGLIKEKLLTLMPSFEIEIGGVTKGMIRKKFTLFRENYDIDFNGWSIDGNFMGWDYDVNCGNRTIMHITKELLHWGDTYVIDIENPVDELMGLMLVIAIDAANCSGNQ